MRGIDSKDLARRIIVQPQAEKGTARENLEKKRDDYRALKETPAIDRARLERPAEERVYPKIPEHYAASFTVERANGEFGSAAVRSLRDYLDCAYFSVNRKLRDEPYSAHGGMNVQEIVDDMTRMIGKCPLPFDAHVLRVGSTTEFSAIFGEQAGKALDVLLGDEALREKASGAFLDGLEKGHEFEYKSFISTSREFDSNARFLKGRPVHFKMNLNKGTPALPVEAINDEHPEEREVILQRGTTFVFENARFDKDKQGLPIIVIEVTTKGSE